MKRIIALLFIFSLIILADLRAQEWTDAQKEVWKTIQTYVSLADKRDLDGFMSYVDENFKGWDRDSDKPVSKMEKAAAIKQFLEMTKENTTKSKLTPLDIWVEGDFAFVHYNFLMVSTSPKNETAKLAGRYTDILRKKDGKWFCVGDHGGFIKEEKPKL